MPETPKKNKAETRPVGSVPLEQSIDGEEANSWEDDQKRRDYYYDDSHGYEVYEGDEAEDD